MSNIKTRFTDEQVLIIYYSTNSIDELAIQYGVSRYNIITIKRKIYYRSITSDIAVLPGFSEKDLINNRSGMFPIDLVKDIFYDTGNYAYFWEKYKVSAREVRSIKSKRTYKKITSTLGIPGQIKRYGLTQDMVDEIYESTGTNKEIAEKFNIHYNTVRNIKSAQSRAFNIWEEF